MGGGAAGSLSDVTNNGRHLGFYQKTARNGNFLCFT